MKGYIVEDEKKPKYKQAIILRKDLKMGCGKACAQSAHASNLAAKHCPTQIVDEWDDAGYHKVVLAVNSKEELERIFLNAVHVHLPCSIIEDFGLTQLEPGTKTAVGIGPARVEDINKIVGHLKLY